ncbi:hypothetical protein [Conexibacter woesei]|uniref:hypothetical protein n=1 Tax=Conexibacter woesei TaxID=191495 RepID=UPI000479C35F|nr:hypothetical protein [Conexibacter woesei]
MTKQDPSVKRPEPPWVVSVLWTLSGGWGLQALVVGVAVVLTLVTGSVTVAVIAGLVVMGVVWFGAPRLARRLTGWTWGQRKSNV